MSGRTVAITGAGSGIGRAIAEAFVQAGDRVHLGDVSEARLAETASAIGAPSAVVTHVLDVSDHAAMERFVAQADGASDGDGDTGTGQGLSVFVNCAGVFDGYAGIEETHTGAVAAHHRGQPDRLLPRVPGGGAGADPEGRGAHHEHRVRRRTPRRGRRAGLRRLEGGDRGDDPAAGHRRRPARA